jgi:hypothetical protein
MPFDMPEQIGYAPEIWSPEFAEVIRRQCDLAVPVQGRTTIFPGQKPILETRWDNAEATNGLLDGKKIIVTYGCIGYFAAGEPHYTWYCFYLMRNGHSGWQLGSSPIGNDAN